MFHISFFKRVASLLATLLALSALAASAGDLAPAPSMGAPGMLMPTLNQPLQKLFSHPGHKEVFEKMGMTCTSCHNFSVRPKESGPLSNPIQGGYLTPVKQICHQCHIGNISLPRSNQCQLCHTHVESLKPESHYDNWILRHGRMAQFNRDSCAQCHTPQGCADCHAMRSTVMPIVHPPNFRLMHSIEARANPQKCMLCHQTANFCIACHTGARQ